MTTSSPLERPRVGLPLWVTAPSEWPRATDDEILRAGIQPDPLPVPPPTRLRRLRPADPRRPERSRPGIQVRLPIQRDYTLLDLPWVKLSELALLVDRRPAYVRRLAHQYGIPIATLPNRVACTFKQGTAPGPRRGRHTVVSQDAARAFLRRYFAENARRSQAQGQDAWTPQQAEVSRVRQLLSERSA
jgi:hypothetical protein